MSPVPASSGKTTRHRLNRGGDRQANRALYVIAVSRMAHDARAHAYVQRRTADGLSKKEIIRCLKRYIARDLYKILTHPKPQTTQTKDLAKSRLTTRGASHRPTGLCSDGAAVPQWSLSAGIDGLLISFPLLVQPRRTGDMTGQLPG